MNIKYTSILTLLFLTNFYYSIQAQLVDFEEKDCKIILNRDLTIASDNNVIQLDFICNNTIIVSSFNFSDKNPYKNMDFPIITESTKFYKVGSHYGDYRRKGNIDFNLSNANLDKVQKEFPHKLDTNFSKYYFSLAFTFCEYKIFTTRAIVNYYISIRGTEDTLSRRGDHLFLGDKLYVLNSLGEIEYSVNGENFAITHPNIDIENDLLIFKTTKMQNNRGISGFEIHDLNYQIPIYDFDFDTTYLVFKPIHGKGDYVIFDVRKESKREQLCELFIFDVHNKKIYQKSFPEDYKYSYPQLSDGKIILAKNIGNDAEGYLVYDTLKISEIIKNNR